MPNSLSPSPWTNTGDTGYTWYTDDSLLQVLPTGRTLTATEVTAYWPVTAHTFDSVEVRASGDVSFTYELIEEENQSYNSHKFYAHTEDNTGSTRQESQIKLVAYSGTSAYSATTMLFKNPANDNAWVTSSPDNVYAASQQNSVTCYISTTNCTRSVEDELTGNTQFYTEGWVTVTRVNNTTITFNFQANTGDTSRTTVYYAYGRDNDNNLVYCRIGIYQNASSMGVTVTPDRASLGQAAGSFTCEVKSTEPGTFTFSAASWMNITSYVPSSEYGGTLYVDYPANEWNWTRADRIWAIQQISVSPYTLSGSALISQANSAETGSLSVTPSTINVGRTAGQVEATISYEGLGSSPVLVEGSGNMSIVSASLSGGVITITYGANDTSLQKTKEYSITATTTNGDTISATLKITQVGTGLPIAPIWRDYVLDLQTPGQGYINYSISYDGTVVYTGRAYGMGRQDIELYFNNLCKNFLSNGIDFTEGFQTVQNWMGNFIITSPELGDITSVSFYEDYSYENRPLTNIMSLNNPITHEVPEGGLVPLSFFVTGTTGTVQIRTNKRITD